MTGNGDELQALWQSQPEGERQIRPPAFGLLDEQAVPDYMPLSGGRRASYLVGFLWMATLYWRTGRIGPWPEYVAPGIGLILAVAGSLLVLRHRHGARTPLPEETVQAYRKALAGEFERQFQAERRILYLLLGGWTLVAILRVRSFEAEVLALPAALILLILFGLRMYNRAAAAVRSRLGPT